MRSGSGDSCTLKTQHELLDHPFSHASLGREDIGLVGAVQDDGGLGQLKLDRAPSERRLREHSVESVHFRKRRESCAVFFAEFRSLAAREQVVHLGIDPPDR